MAEDVVDRYLQRLDHLRAQAEATPELSLREPLLDLVRVYGSEVGRPSLLVAQEASAGAVGQPDVFVKDGPRLIGFVETKAPGAPLLSLLMSSPQLRKYAGSLPNWVLTDYYDFIFIRNGEAEPAVNIVKQPEAVAEGFAKFFDSVPRNIRSASRLAQEMARRARLLRDGLYGALRAEGQGGPLRVTLDFYRRHLMDDLTEEDFADTFAQTAVYGMFLGWLRWAEDAEPTSSKRGRAEREEFTRTVAVAEIPASVPFLRASLRLLTDEELLPIPVARLLDDLAALFDNTHAAPIRKETAAMGLGANRDMTIYFYERFLERYDAGERKKRGVYYTPPELVAYVVRAVQDLLAAEFGRASGLADPSVVVLDPAVGTGTFLLGAAERALDVLASQGTAAQRHLIHQHLLQHFYGFELLAAPYAVAHLKVSSFFEQHGYRLTDHDRAQIYLTNTLHGEDQPTGQLELLPMLSGITDESVAAEHIKRDVPVLVVLGNPPYERTSHNSNRFSNRLQDDFYKIDGERLPDRNSGPLKDDYLRFIRWATWKLLEQDGAPGHGVLAFVTNRAFIERTLHRAVRKFLLDRFDEIHVYDLHGDQREWFRDRVDEKVFKQVQAGIAVTVFVKKPNGAPGPATVRYRDDWGTREQKLVNISSASLTDDAWTDLHPHPPLWLMVPSSVPDAYDTWPTVAQLFPVNVIGVQTHRDQLVVADTEQELRHRLADFANPAVADSEWTSRKVASNRDWNLQSARSALAKEPPRNVRRWNYRGLEQRWVAFDERLIDYTRTKVSPHLLQPGNLTLAFSNGSLTDGPYALVSRGPVPAAVLSWRTFGAAYMAPLWLHSDTSTHPMPNLPGNLIDRLGRLGLRVTPERLLHYVYAILNSPAFRAEYADGLRYGFARIPITGDPAVFDALAAHGKHLVDAHLLEHPDLAAAAPQMNGNDQATLQAPVHDPTSDTLTLAPDLTAHPVTAAMWAYQQGAYPVLRDFLDQRQDRPLAPEEFEEFRGLVAAVKISVDLLPQIDAWLPRATETAVTAQALGLALAVSEKLPFSQE